MALFGKKNCDICGGKIGLLGNRKLEDGNICKDCAKKLSPWFTERRHSNLQEIKSQLDAREKNKALVSSFNATESYGKSYNQLFIDRAKGNFAVCGNSDFEKKNPDILPLSSIVGCRTRRDEHRKELKYEDSEGKKVSYNPPRYEYSYDFYCTITLKHPYIDEIEFKINSSEIDRNGGFLIDDFNRKMNECDKICDDINRALNGSVGMSGSMGFGTGASPYGEGAPGFGNASSGFSNMGAFTAGIAGAAASSDLQFDTLEIPSKTIVYMNPQGTGGINVSPITSINVLGNVSYRIVNSDSYNTGVVAKGVNLVNEMQFVIEATFMKMSQAGVNAYDLSHKIKEINEKFKQLTVELGYQVRYGIEVTDCFIFPEFSREDLDAMAAGAVQKAINNSPEEKREEVAAAFATMGGAASGEWECPNCGGKNKGKFCENCGTPRP